MEFDKNGRIVLPTKSKKGKEKIKFTEKISHEKDKIAIIKQKDAGVLPIVNEKCKKCGHGEAYFWTVQTRSGDEAETKFFKCTKCENTWREYR